MPVVLICGITAFKVTPPSTLVMLKLVRSFNVGGSELFFQAVTISSFIAPFKRGAREESLIPPSAALSPFWSAKFTFLSSSNS